jgi:hypothetical protein
VHFLEFDYVHEKSHVELLSIADLSLSTGKTSTIAVFCC